MPVWIDPAPEIPYTLAMPKRPISGLILLTSLLLLAGCAFSGSGNAGESSSSSREPRKTYESAKFGIALEYPAHWTVYDDKSNRRHTGEDITFNTGKPGRLEGIRVERIAIRDKVGEETLSQYRSEEMVAEVGRR